MTGVRLGIGSTAHLHAAGYAPLLADLDCEFVGIADDDADRAASFAADHGVETWTPTELLDRVDGVVVCAANADHADWVERAADAGVDVLCEKPLAPDGDEARALVDRCTAAGVELGVAMPLRFSEPARRARRVLDAGRVGDVRALSGTNRGQLPGGWFVDPEAAGGGAVTDHTVHVVDLVHWLTGERVAEVYAETATMRPDLAVEDVNLLSMELTDGTVFTLDGSWSRPDGDDFWGDATLDVVGSDGRLSVDCFDQRARHVDADGIDAVFWGSDPDEAMLADFVAAVAAGRPPETTGREGVEAVRVVEAAYASAERGTRVTVGYDD